MSLAFVASSDQPENATGGRTARRHRSWPAVDRSAGAALARRCRWRAAAEAVSELRGKLHARRSARGGRPARSGWGCAPQYERRSDRRGIAPVPESHKAEQVIQVRGSFDSSPCAGATSGAKVETRSRSESDQFLNWIRLPGQLQRCLSGPVDSSELIQITRDRTCAVHLAKMTQPLGPHQTRVPVGRSVRLPRSWWPARPS